MVSKPRIPVAVLRYPMFPVFHIMGVASFTASEHSASENTAYCRYFLVPKPRIRVSCVVGVPVFLEFSIYFVMFAYMFIPSVGNFGESTSCFRGHVLIV